MIDPTEWQLYSSASGGAVVAKEIQKCGLTTDEQGALQRMLERIATGEVLKKDTKYIKAYGLWEARLDGDRRTFRMLFAKRNGNAVLVGLYFTGKKKNKLATSVFETASRRLAEWDEREAN